MECLFDGCDNFVRYLNNKKWIEESDDPDGAIRKSFQWASFTEAMYSRLEAEDKVDEFAVKYSAWRDAMSLPKLKYAGFKSACDELLNTILVDNMSDRYVVQTALDAYLEQCGEERTGKFLTRFSAECLLLKLFTNFIVVDGNYEDAETQGRLCKAVWYDAILRMLPQEATSGEDRWKEHIAQLMRSSKGVETLIFLSIMRDENIAKVSSMVIDRFHLNLACDTVPVEGAVASFWQNFIRCDKTLLLLMFQNHSDFFEEFFEFFLKFANELRFDDVQQSWTADNWLEFADVVTLIQALTTCDDQNLSNYCAHIINSMEGNPLWQAVKSQINNP
ncbi:Hypothetical predicted protein [Cloeon dipterum]|uniref:Uncharacterized protein n=1 Tax=Cloeon dipterum TaxID=197152 RepID=A0A8S1E729_9INSE|nr:Hypothetical predicted protein [Cloeon dipterum]